MFTDNAPSNGLGSTANNGANVSNSGSNSCGPNATGSSHGANTTNDGNSSADNDDRFRSDKQRRDAYEAKKIAL